MGGERKIAGSRIIAAFMAIAGIACAPQQQSASPSTSVGAAAGGGWIDATASLAPATAPVYEGDAPMKFDFLKDMRKGDGFTLSVLSLGAHSGTHIDAPMHFVREGASIDRLSLEPLI